MPIIACQVHDGAVRSMRGIMAPASSTRSDVTRLIPITTAAVRNASGTAHRLEKRCAASQTRMTGADRCGGVPDGDDRRQAQRHQNPGEHRLREGGSGLPR